MPFKKTINFKKLERAIINTRVKNLALLSNEIISDIIARTQHGKDVNNRGFKKYSKLYSIRKRKTHGTKVNLTVSGKMLNNIRWKKIPNGIRLYFSSSHERAKAHGNQIKNKRKFFGTDRRQDAKIKKRMGKL